MTDRVLTSRKLNYLGAPLVLGRLTTVVATTIVTVNTWTAMDISTMVQHKSEDPDYTVRALRNIIPTDIAGADHKITLAFDPTVYERTLRFELYSAACGHADTGTKDGGIGLFDVQTYSTPALGAEQLFAENLDDMPADETADTLLIDKIIKAKYNAELRLFVINYTDDENLEFDPLIMRITPIA